MEKVVVSLSGGLDSTILTYLLVDQYKKENVHALSFDYNQTHSFELEKAKLTCNKLGIEHKIIDIKFLGDMISNVSALSNSSSLKTPTIKESLGDPQPISYVPFRNQLLSTLCLSYAEAINAVSIYLAFQQQDIYGYWDTTKEFVKRLNYVNELNRKNYIEIITPFVDKSKAEEIELGNLLNVPFEDTRTCYSKDEISCGKCLSCSDRIANFAKAGIIDPIEYSIDINWEELFKKYAK